jgi:hypothetical protein
VRFEKALCEYALCSRDSVETPENSDNSIYHYLYMLTPNGAMEASLVSPLAWHSGRCCMEMLLSLSFAEGVNLRRNEFKAPHSTPLAPANQNAKIKTSSNILSCKRALLVLTKTCIHTRLGFLRFHISTRTKQS